MRKIYYMKKSALLLIGLFTLSLTNGCAATKDSRDAQIASGQNSGYMVKITNKTVEKMSFSYDKFDSNSLTFAWNEVKNGETKIISIRKGGSLKLKYNKNNKEIEENISINDDKKIEVTNQGVTSNDLTATEKSEIHF